MPAKQPRPSEIAEREYALAHEARAARRTRWREFFSRLRRASDHGHPAADCELGRWFQLPREDRAAELRSLIPRSDTRGAKLLLRAARAGYTDAFSSIAYCYDAGVGVRRSEAAAMRWYRRGARAGDLISMFNIATIYRDRGDRRRERYWLRRAAKLGDYEAPLVLAEIELASGRGIRATKARKYLERRARSSRESVRFEAREILDHFERTGRRRWDPSTRR